MASKDSDNTPMKEEAAAEYIGMSVSYLRLSRMRGATKCTSAPPFIRIGKAIRYLPRDLDAWIESRREFPGEGRLTDGPTCRRPGGGPGRGGDQLG